MSNVDHSLNFESLEKRNLLAALTVTTPLDIVDSGDLLLSLREAIIQANANQEDDVIQLAAGTYSISIPGIYEDSGLTGDLDILADADHRLEILGHVDGTIIDAAQLDRALDIHGGSDVSLSQLTIRNGSLLNEPEFTGRRGGAIRSTQSSLSLAEVEIHDSTAGFSGVGGGVWISGGTYSIQGTTIQGTSASIDGTALFARNSTGEIAGKSGVFNTSVVNANPGGADIVGAVTVRGGSLAIEATKIDFNYPATGIKVVGGVLDAVHVRIMETWNGIHATDSQVTVTNSRISLTYGSNAIFAGGNSDLAVTNIYFGANNFRSIHFEGQNLTVSSALIDQTHARHNSHPSIDVSSAGNTNQQIRIDQVEFLYVRTPVMVIDTPDSGASVAMSDISVSRSYRPWSSNSLRVMFDIAADEVAMTHMDVPLEINPNLMVGMRIVADVFSLDHSSLRDFERGIALDIDASQIDIRNSTISGNRWGIAVRSAGPGNITRISNTTVSGGKPSQSGFGAAPELATALEWSPVNSQLIIDGSTFLNNESESGLAVVKIGGENNEVLVTGTRLEGNVTDSTNGPFHIGGAGHQVTVANSLFVDNRGVRAGVFYVDASDSSLSIYSSTLVRNLTSPVPFDSGGGGVVRAVSADGLQLLVSNSILVANGYNGAIEGSHIRNDNGNTTVRNSDIVDFNAGDGNILFGGAANGNTDAMPIFVDYFGNDFRLRQKSPLIDIGNLADLVPDDFDLDGDMDHAEPLPDLDALDRVFGAGLDLGAYEFSSVV